MEVWEELSNKRTELDLAIKVMKERGIEKAQCEAVYRKELAKKILYERADGVPVTIINDICRGDERIAELKLNRDTAEILYNTAHEKVMAVKIELRILEKHYELEWKNG